MKKYFPLFVFFSFITCSSQNPNTSSAHSNNPKKLVEEKFMAESLYLKHCANCHGIEREGLSGPALLPESLERVKSSEIQKIILEGRPLTQMRGFAPSISKVEAEILANYVLSAAKVNLDWPAEKIKASLEKFNPESKLKKPVFKDDPLNLFFLVESLDHHVSVISGDNFKVLDRFATPIAVHGGVKYSLDGRFAYLSSRDGWVLKYDVWNLKKIAQIRVGINTRNIALSGDGRYLMAANYLPKNLVVLDTQNMLLSKIIEIKTLDGSTSRASAVYVAPPRKSFVVALKDAPEIWEIPYDPGINIPEPGSYVHDFRPESGEPIKMQAQPFPIRHIQSESIMDDFFFDQDYKNLLGASREGGKALVVNMIVGRPISSLNIEGMPHLGAGITWQAADGGTILATPNLKKGQISFVDMKNWKILKHLSMPGPGFFLRSHENTPFAWADAFMSPKKDTLYLIDKKTLEIAKTLTPIPGKTAAHVEFTRDGKYVLVSIWENDGFVIVYNAENLKEIKRLPMKKPSGKYNVFNKIHFSEGTSH